MTTPTLTEARASIGLRTPSYQAKQLIWSKCSVPTAEIKAGYAPTYNARLAHQANAPGVAVSGGFRAGKSLFSGMEGVAWLPYAKLIWLVAKDYDMSRQEFIYIAEAAVSCGLAVERDIHLSLSKYSPCVMRSINGCVVETRTLSDFRKLASKAPDVVIVCEPGQIDNLKRVIQLIHGRLSEKRGLLIIAGTSDQSSEEWFELWSQWARPNLEGYRSFSIPTWQNTYKYPRGRKELTFESYERQYGHEALMAHYGGQPAPPYNLVLRGFWNEKVHVQPDLVWQPNRPTEIAIDPNYAAPNAYTVECIQWDLETGDIFLVDEVSESGLNHDAVKAIVAEREWFRYVTGGTIDPFAEGNVLGNYVPSTYWLPLPLRHDHRPRVATTVQALKEAMALRSDGSAGFHVAPRCERFRREAAKWRNDKYGRPEKPWCDALKATGYWLVDRYAVERTPGWGDDESNEVLASDWRFE